MALNFLKRKKSKRPSTLIYKNIQQKQTKDTEYLHKMGKLFSKKQEVPQVTPNWEKAKAHINDLISEISSEWKNSIDKNLNFQNKLTARANKFNNQEETYYSEFQASSELYSTQHAIDITKSVPLDKKELQDISSIAKRLKTNAK